MTKNEKVEILQNCINGMVEELAPVVVAIEDAPAMSKNNYLAYMGVLSSWKAQYEAKHPHEASKPQMQMMVISLVKAGANPDGVFAAMEQVLPDWAE